MACLPDQPTTSWKKGTAQASTSGIACAFLNASTCYEFYDVPGLGLKYYLSTDGGATFPVTHSTTAFTGQNILGARQFVDPATGLPVFIILTAEFGLFLSRDLYVSPDNSTWTTSSLPGPSTGAALSFEVGRSVNQVCVVGQDGATNLKLFTSNDYGATFPNIVTIVESIALPTGTQQAASPATDVWLVLNAASGKIRRSTNNGASWSIVATLTGTGKADTGVIYAIDSANMVACYRSQVATSADAGATWTNRQDLSASTGDLVAIQTASSGVLWAGSHSWITNGTGSSLLAWVSTDKGVTWNSLPIDSGTGYTSAPRVTGMATWGTNAVFTGVNGVNSAQQYWYANTAFLTFSKFAEARSELWDGSSFIVGATSSGAVYWFNQTEPLPHWRPLNMQT